VPDPRQHRWYTGLCEPVAGPVAEPLGGGGILEREWRWEWTRERDSRDGGRGGATGIASGELGAALSADPGGGSVGVPTMPGDDAGDFGDHGAAGGGPDPGPRSEDRDPLRRWAAGGGERLVLRPSSAERQVR
jgi:hypothetical protein